MNNLYYFQHCGRKDGFLGPCRERACWVGSPVFLCTESAFPTLRWNRQIFCCSKTGKDIDIDIQATYKYANVDAYRSFNFMG